MAEQRESAIADQVDGGLVSGHEQQDAGGEQLILAERVAGFLGGDESREHVTTR